MAVLDMVRSDVRIPGAEMSGTTKAAVLTGSLIYTAAILSWLLLAPPVQALMYVYPSIGCALGVSW